MIKSIWQITFTPNTGSRAGEAIVLLDTDDLMEAEPTLPISQGVADSVPLFSPFGHSFALGGAKTTASWTRRRDLPGMLPRTQALTESYRFPWGIQGTITVALDGGATWAWSRSSVESIEPSYPLVPGENNLQQKYQARCGVMALVAGPLPEDTPAIWEFLVTDVCPDWDDITTDWDDILLTPIT
jgi:hypothetical protein